MIDFDKTQRANITLALNVLSVGKYIDYFHVYENFATIDFDFYEVAITVPVKGALQFTLKSDDRLLESIVTETVCESLPIQRLVNSLFGVVMMEQFESEWDGYSSHEINMQYADRN